MDIKLSELDTEGQIYRKIPINVRNRAIRLRGREWDGDCWGRGWGRVTCLLNTVLSGETEHIPGMNAGVAHTVTVALLKASEHLSVV